MIWFSTERFIRDIALGDCCFICGASPLATKFNDEHILPAWLLRKYDLFARRLSLPNGSSARYDQYTLPCCNSCNSLMGEQIEEPISQLFQDDGQAVYKELETRGPLRLFVWLGLIYLKTHLKDRLLRFHLDRRKGEQLIADDYDWEHLHHIHTVVRCFYTGSEVAPEVIGSFICLPMGIAGPEEIFDWADLYLAQTIMMRLGSTGFVSVFNDSNGALTFFMQRLEKITGRLGNLQMREVMAEIASLNLHLKVRPIFLSIFDFAAEKHRIVAKHPPEVELEDWQPEIKGRLLHHSLQSITPLPQFLRYTTDQAMEKIKSGQLTFLFNDKGEFIPFEQSWLPLKHKKKR